MPLDFNAVTLAFAPKAREEADEAEGVARRPSELRPLAMKLTANKLVCAAWAAQLRGVIVEDTPVEQRGGIHGRQILQNVLDLDCAARSRAIQRGFPGSALVLLDMAAAFPSLAHWWLHSVLLHMKLLAAFRAVVGMMNAVVVAHGTAGGLRSALFCVLAGVQQGCPLSGALYTLATSPLLRAVVVLTRGRATLRAFADDWGCVVSASRDLKPLHAVCRVAARAANLCIKPAKSVIIPLQGDANCEATRARWRARLRQDAPTWRDFGIQDHGKYLGFWLGPGAPDVFEGLVARCDRIVNTIREAGLPPSIGTLLFNRHCPACMVYFGQLALPSFDLARVTARHLNALLHLPGSSLTRWWSQAASTLGMIRPISYQSTALAALARTAADTRLEWRGQFAALMELARDEAPIAFATSHAQPHSWNRPPFAAMLARASGDPVPMRPHTFPDQLAATARLAIQIARMQANGNNFRTQAVAYRALDAPPSQDMLATWFCSKLARIGIKAQNAHILLLISALPKLGPQPAAHANRLLLHGWPTAKRFQCAQGGRPCVFGCPPPWADDQLHYMSCPALRVALGPVLGINRHAPPHIFMGFAPVHGQPPDAWGAILATECYLVTKHASTTAFPAASAHELGIIANAAARKFPRLRAPRRLPTNPPAT